jgi:hypothetical protein
MGGRNGEENPQHPAPQRTRARWIFMRAASLRAASSASRAAVSSFTRFASSISRLVVSCCVPVSEQPTSQANMARQHQQLRTRRAPRRQQQQRSCLRRPSERWHVAEARATTALQHTLNSSPPSWWWPKLQARSSAERTPSRCAPQSSHHHRLHATPTHCVPATPRQHEQSSLLTAEAARSPWSPSGTRSAGGCVRAAEQHAP